MEYRVLKEEELENWFLHCEGLFHPRTNTYFRDHYWSDPDRHIQGIFVCILDGQIISTVRVFHRKIYVNNTEVTMGGIGEVSTKEPYRGQGIAGKLLEIAIEYMRNQKFQVSMLSAGKQASVLYTRHGWKGLPCSVHSLKGLQSIPQRDATGYSVVWSNYSELKPQQQKQVEELYKTNSKHLVGPLVRSSLYWEHWISNKTNTPYSWVVRNKATDQVTGYLSIHKSTKGFSIADLCVNLDLPEKEIEAHCWDLLNAAIIHLKLNLADAEICYPSVSVAQPFFKGEPSVDDCNMFKVLDESFGTSQECLKLFSGDKFLFWDVDGF